MGQLITGILFILFGLAIGGVGLATAGVGVGIPMIPLGAYVAVRGIRVFWHEKLEKEEKIQPGEKLESFEKTKLGKLGLGLLLILIGVGTSAILIGIPIIFVGIWFIYLAFKNEINFIYRKIRGLFTK